MDFPLLTQPNSTLLCLTDILEVEEEQEVEEDKKQKEEEVVGNEVKHQVNEKELHIKEEKKGEKVGRRGNNGTGRKE